MKKTFVFILAGFAFMAFSCNSTKVESKTVSVELESNPTTGYSWKCKIESPDVVVLTNQEYTPDEHKEGMVGCGGIEKFNFTCKKEGSSLITFTYLRPWEEEAESEVVVKKAKLTVDKKLNGKIEFEE